MGKSKDKKKEKDVNESAVEPESVEEERLVAGAEKSLDQSTGPESDRPSYSELVKRVNVIAKPLAGKKLTKKLHKAVRKASKVKSIRRGVKEVAKALRKGEKGVVVFAGDISPIDVISHLPIMCEDRSIPYCYVPSRMDLGLASQTKRPTSVVMIRSHSDTKEHYDECFAEVKSLPLPI